MLYKNIGLLVVGIMLALISPTVYAQRCVPKITNWGGNDLYPNTWSTAELSGTGVVEYLYKVHQVPAGQNYNGGLQRVIVSIDCSQGYDGIKVIGFYMYSLIGAKGYSLIRDWSPALGRSLVRSGSKAGFSGIATAYVRGKVISSNQGFSRNLIAGTENLFPSAMGGAISDTSPIVNYSISIAADEYQVATNDVSKILTAPDVVYRIYEIIAAGGIPGFKLEGRLRVRFVGMYDGCKPATYSLDYPKRVHFGNVYQNDNPNYRYDKPFNITLKSTSSCSFGLRPHVTFKSVDGKLIDENTRIDLENGLALSFVDKQKQSNLVKFNEEVIYSQVLNGQSVLKYDARLTKTAIPMQNGFFSTNVKFTVEYR